MQVSVASPVSLVTRDIQELQELQANQALVVLVQVTHTNLHRDKKKEPNSWTVS